MWLAVEGEQKVIYLGLAQVRVRECLGLGAGEGCNKANVRGESAERRRRIYDDFKPMEKCRSEL